MSTDRDYYDIMGVPKGASQDDIKKAYRELVKKYHPDLHKDDPEAPKHMAEVNEAYDSLSDPAKRQQYDTYGKAGPTGFPGTGQAWGGPGDGSGETFGGFDIGDLFGSFMGGFGRQQQEETPRGRDLSVNLTLTLGEAIFGAKREVQVRRYDTCATCHGSGAAAGTSPKVCPTCNGAGEVRQVQNTIFGRVVTAGVCPTCRGEGRTIDSPCPTCKGSGITKSDKTIEVTIPAGVDTAMKVRIAGQGDAGKRGGQAGDLYLFITVERDSRFERQGGTLYHVVRITPAKAVLGTTIAVPLIEGGTESITIPAGSQHGTEVRLRGKGAQAVGERRRGDYVVRVEIGVPKTLTAEQRKLYKQLVDIEK
ncbi:MAG: molecular chaperone DnaJ [Candidatus Cryosericum sp.]